jgi:hypothetical protein
MADDQFFRHALDLSRIAGERLYCVGQGPSLRDDIGA